MYKKIAFLVVILLLSLVYHGNALAQFAGAGNSGMQIGENGGSNSAPSTPPMVPQVDSGSSVGAGSAGSGSKGNIPSLIGLSSDYMSTGVGAGFLGTLLGAETFSKINMDVGVAAGNSTSTQFQGSENPAFKGLMEFGAYLGSAIATLLVIFHGVLMFFNKMEYGDVMGEAKDRFIGFTRAALAFGLIMPVASGGLASAQYVVGFSAVASNGIGNKAAEMVMVSGFGSESSALNILDVAHETDPSKTAEIFSQMVGQQACVAHMKSVGATASETRRRCATATVGGSNENGDLDVPFEDGVADSSSDAAYCSDKYSNGKILGNSEEKAFLHNSCKKIRARQRKAYAEVGAIYDEYDGDISSPEAQKKLQSVAKQLQGSMDSEIEAINSAVAAENIEGGAPGKLKGGSFLSHEMAKFINNAGWPGLGLMYSAIGSQMDVVTGLQAMNGTDSEGFSLDRLNESGRNANAAKRKAQEGKSYGAAAIEISNNIEGESIKPGGVAKWFAKIGDALGVGAEFLNNLVADGMHFIFKPAFEDPGPVATHKIGSTILGSIMLAAIAIDGAKLYSNVTPVGKAISGASKLSGGMTKVFKKLTGKAKDQDGGMFSGSIIVKLVIAYLGILVMLILLVATFLVLVIPKIPVFLVTFLALEWAIWCAIVIFGAPLWVALNMTTIGNQPGMFTQRALSGLQVLLYIILFPTLVVAGVVISVMAYNMVIPVLSTMLLMTFSGGLVEMVLGIFAMPLIMLMGLMVGAFVSITAINRIPNMITNYLGVSAPGGSVSESINTFIASPTSFSNLSNPQAAITKGGAAALGAKAGKGKK